MENLDYRQKDVLQDLYRNKKLSTYQMAELYKIDRSTIDYWLKKHNIPLRSYGERIHLGNANYCGLTKEALEWLNGELLGDGCLQSQSNYSARFAYGSKYDNYINYISDTLSDFGIKQSGKIIKQIVKGAKGKSFKEDRATYSYNSLNYEDLLSLYRKWYPNKKKIVPKDIKLVPVTVRQWYIGDGSLIFRYNRQSYITLATCGFIIEDVEFLVRKLNELGLKATRQPAWNVIHISTYSVKDFLNYIGKCPVECYKYKWDLNRRLK